MSAQPERIGDVIPLVRPDASRVRENELASFSPSSTDELASSAAPFSEVVRAVELADDEPLVNPGRALCEDAYRASPAGFVKCVADTMAREYVRKTRRHLLVWKVQHGDHLLLGRLADTTPDAVDSWKLRVEFDDADEVLIERHPSREACLLRAGELKSQRQVFDTEICGPAGHTDEHGRSKRS